MNLINKTKKLSSDPEAEKKIKAILDELDVKHYAFKKESALRLNHIEKHLEAAEHEANVADHELAEDISQASKKIHKAASGIIFPEDLA